MDDLPTPRRTRATYGGSAKRRRLTAPRSAEVSSESDSSPIKPQQAWGRSKNVSPSLAAFGALKSRTRPASPTLDPRAASRSSRSKDLAPASASRSSPRPSIALSPPTSPAERASTPPPKGNGLDDDVLRAFELASPGSSQAAGPSQEAIESPLPRKSSLRRIESFDEMMEQEEVRLRPSGVASRMSKARKASALGFQPDSNATREAAGDQGTDFPRRSAVQDRSPSLGPLSPFVESQMSPQGKRPASYHQSGHSPRAKVDLGQLVDDEAPSGSRILTKAPATSVSNVKGYGGSFRTYLADLRTSSHDKAEAAASEEGPSVRSAAEVMVSKANRQRESYADLRSKWSLDDPPLPASNSASLHQNSSTGSLKSLTNLRSAGTLQRFEAELQFVLQGLDASQPLRLRRTGAVALLKQMAQASDEEEEQASEGSFLQRLSASGNQRRIWTTLRQSGAGQGRDEVLDTCLVGSLLLLVSDGALGDDFLADLASDICEALAAILDGIIEPPCTSSELAHGSDEEQQQMLSDLSDIFRLRETEAFLLPRQAVLSTICALGFLPSSTSDADMIQLLNNQHTGCRNSSVANLLARLFNQRATEAARQVTLYEDGSRSLSAWQTNQQEQVRLLSIGEITLLLQALEIMGGRKRPAISAAPTIAAQDCRSLLHWLRLMQRDEGQAVGASIATASLLTLALQHCSEDNEWAEDFVCDASGVGVLVHLITQLTRSLDERPESGKGTGSSNDFDTVCLALALLTNLLETTAAAPRQLWEVCISTSCDAPREDRSTLSALEALFKLCMETRRLAEGSDGNAIEERGQPSQLSSTTAADVDHANCAFLSGCLSVAVALGIQGDILRFDALMSELQEGRPSDTLSLCLDEFAAENGVVLRMGSASQQAVLAGDNAGASVSGETEDIVARMALQVRQKRQACYGAVDV